MRVTCTQDNFKKAIYNTERVVSKQNTLPILNNILFETYKGGLRLTATNLEIGIQVKIGAKVDKEGKITIPAKLVGNFSNNLSQAENITLELVEQGLKIKNGSVKALIKGMSAQEFPLIPIKKSQYLLKIPASDLKTLISKIIISVAFNEARQELTGVNVIFSQDKLFFAATDSFRLSEYQLDIKEGMKNNELYDTIISKNNSLIIPANTLIELNRIIPNDSKGDVQITLEEGQVFFDFEGVSVVSRLINGKYPEYKHIIPSSHQTVIIGERTEIQNAVKIASIFAASKGNEIILKINDQGEKVLVNASSQEVGENSTEVKFSVSGPAQEVTFNAKYFLDGINTLSSTKIAILVNNNSSPVVLREIDENSGEISGKYTYIVMPIKN